MNFLGIQVNSPCRVKGVLQGPMLDDHQIDGLTRIQNTWKKGGGGIDAANNKCMNKKMNTCQGHSIRGTFHNEHDHEQVLGGIMKFKE